MRGYALMVFCMYYQANLPQVMCLYALCSLSLCCAYRMQTSNSASSTLAAERWKEAKEHSYTKYERSRWRHWIDADKDCQNSRHEVLIRDSLQEVSFQSPRKCKVKSGLWKCPYTAKVFEDPRSLDIDHVVPLKEAFRSGAYLWDKDQKRSYANDLQNPKHLLAAEAKANRSKGDKDIAKWLPDQNKCQYLKIWLEIKENYQLSMDAQEINAAKRLLSSCPF